MTPTCHYLSWNQPLAPQVATWLLQQTSTSPCPDLSSILVLVPTAEAGRILRAELLHQTQQQALLPPDIRTPAQWLPHDDPTLTAPLDSELIWTDLLLEINPADYPHLIPQPSANQDLAWATSLARLLTQLQNTLLDQALTIEDVAQKSDLLHDADRWQDLACLEKKWNQKLQALGLRNRSAAWRNFIENPTLPVPAQRVVLAGLPDPIPCLLRALEKIPQVDVLIHAPKDQADHFDHWGRPESEHWTQTPLQWSADCDHLHICETESSLAEHAATLAQPHSPPDATLIGLARQSLAPYLHDLIPHLHDPAGTPASLHEIWNWFHALQQWLESQALADLLTLLRQPATSRLWFSQNSSELSSTLLALDKLQQNHLARHESDLFSIQIKTADLQNRLTALSQTLRTCRARLNSKDWLAHLTEMAAIAFPDNSLDHPARELARAIMENIRRLATYASKLKKITPGTILSLTLRHCAELHLPTTRPDHALEIKSWLELSWDPRPHLILCGLQEGDVPYHPADTLFLPESLRQLLRLRTSELLLARDAYLFQTLAASRACHGRLDVLLARYDHQSDPLLPSRILLLCSDEELPERIHRLFRSPATPSAPTPPPAAPLPLQLPLSSDSSRTISVTSFKVYLQSPLLYHFQRGLGWEEIQPDKSELDARDFGTLAHDALEAFGKDAQLSTCTDPAVISQFLKDHLHTEAHQLFGPRLPASVAIQLDALAARFHRFAELQAQEAQAGWKIIAVEQKFECSLGHWTLKGKIDRVDQDSNGRIRLLDYKTTDKPKLPEDAHLKSATDVATAKAPAEALFSYNGKDHLWLDLQLPLYVWHWLQAHSDLDPQQVSCGYILLPKALQDTAFAIWDDGAALCHQALDCAQRILSALYKGLPLTALNADCWKSKPWSFWFPGGPESSFHLSSAQATTTPPPSSTSASTPPTP